MTQAAAQDEVGGARVAQEGRQDEADEPNFVLLSQMIGARVDFAKDEDVEQGRQKTTGGPPAEHGWLFDLVFDFHTGHVLLGLVYYSERLVTVPFRGNFVWKPETETFDLTLDRERLDARAAFDLDDARNLGLLLSQNKLDAIFGSDAYDRNDDEAEGLDGADTRRTGEDASDREAVGNVTRRIAETPFVTIPIGHFTGRELLTFPLYAKAERFGSSIDAVFDRDEIAIVAAIADREEPLEDGPVLMLLETFEVCWPQEEDEEPQKYDPKHERVFCLEWELERALENPRLEPTEDRESRTLPERIGEIVDSLDD